MAISGGDGSIILTIKVDQSGLNKGMKSMQNGVKSLSSSFKALGSTIAAVFSVTAIINFSKQAGEFATQTEASIQRLIDIYGEAAQRVGDFIDANAMAIGMSKASASSFASVYGNLFSVWADQNTNAELTNRYLNMTAVVASKTGRTVADVQERIRSGLLGNTEAIEDLGIFVNVKTIEMTDAFQRMANGKSWEQLDAYTQQQVRTMAILEQATTKYGNTVADTTATTRAQWNAAYEDFKNTWGQVVNRILIPIMKWATTALQYLNGILTGFFNLSQETVKQSNATSSSVENQKDLKNAIKETNKEAKKSLASFDEINILTQQGADNVETSAGGAITIPEIEDFSVSTAIDTDSFEKGIDVGKRLRAVFQPLIDIFGEFGAVVTVVVIALLGFFAIKWLLGWLTNLGKTSKTASAGFGKFLDKLGSAAMAIAILGGLALVIRSISGLITAFSESGLTLGEVAGLLAIAIGGVTVAMLALVAASILLGTNPMAMLAVLAVAGALSLVLVALGAALPPILDAFGDFVVKTTPPLILAITAISTAIEKIIYALGTELPPIINEIGSLFEKVFKGISQIVDSVFDGIGDVIDKVGDNIVKILEGIADLIDNVLDAIIDFVNKAGPAINNFVDNIIEAVTKLINFMVSGIEYMVNRLVIDGVNGIIDGINAIGKYVGFTVPSVPEFTIPRFIPKLAQGAVIPPNREFLAVLGDQKQGTNIEAPLQTIVDAFNIALAQNGNAGSGKTEVILEIDGREFGRAVVEQGNKESRRIGTRLVIA